MKDRDHHTSSLFPITFPVCNLYAVILPVEGVAQSTYKQLQSQEQQPVNRRLICCISVPVPFEPEGGLILVAIFG